MFSHPTKKILCVALLFSVASVSAQPFSRSDSGWVKIFNGSDFTGLYSRFYNEPVVHPVDAGAFKILYPGTDTASIYVVPGAKGGHFGTDKTSYSHYRMHVERRFDVLFQNNNAGLTYHTDESVIRMEGNTLATGNWPRSIEFQMQQYEPGAAYSIQQVTFTTRVNGGNYAQTGGTLVDACGTIPPCNRRNYGPSPTIPESVNGVAKWLRYDLVARGADTAYHIINDTLVFKLWNIRISNDKTNNTPNGPYDHGGVALQSEGSSLKYRRWEIMEFPPKTPMSENYLHRLFLDNPDSGASLAINSTYAVHWRTIGTTGNTGTVPSVNLEYAVGIGTWQSIANNVPNTGTYNWTVPNQTTTQLRLRISASEWVWADSSRAYNTITSSTAIQSHIRPSAQFTIEGKSQTFKNIQNFSSLEIRDAFGRLIRKIPIEEKNIHWDLTNSKGNKVRPGFYFFSFYGNTDSRKMRAIIY